MIILLVLLLQIIPTCPIDEGFVTSSFGMRDHPIEHRRKMHRGIDFSAKVGTPVRAIWEGRVVKSRSTGGGYGRIIVIESGEMRVLYAHLSRLIVRKGDAVNPGDVIGLSGSSGASTGPHLHFGLFSSGRARDPGPILSACYQTEFHEHG